VLLTLVLKVCAQKYCVSRVLLLSCRSRSATDQAEALACHCSSHLSASSFTLGLASWYSAFSAASSCWLSSVLAMLADCCRRQWSKLGQVQAATQKRPDQHIKYYQPPFFEGLLPRRRNQSTWGLRASVLRKRRRTLRVNDRYQLLLISISLFIGADS